VWHERPLSFGDRPLPTSWIEWRLATKGYGGTRSPPEAREKIRDALTKYVLKNKTSYKSMSYERPILIFDT